MSDVLSPLIDAASLQALLLEADTDVLLLDCRFNLADAAAGEAAWRAGHIPGAVHAHLDRDLSGPQTGRGTPCFNGRHPLPSAAALERTLAGWALSPETRVVAYDDAGGMFAARAWWLLQWVGHARVQVLDGGWPAWRALGGAASALAPVRAPTTVALQPRAAWLVTAAEVLAAIGQPDTSSGRPAGPTAASGPALQLLDARAPDRFRGENETLDPVGGHIPTARNRFFQLNLVDGHFKPAAVLREEFTALLQGQPLQRLVHHCGSGVTACHNLLAMAHAGLPPTRLFAGSWSEWCADPTRPVARGDAFG
jgi:thiosulfate/3-mercaptopyruvate sulfurtransferase